jgi:hypothetical protein
LKERLGEYIFVKRKEIMTFSGYFNDGFYMEEI